jgi:ATP-binding cassette subfamily B multidrug efflux pump
LIGFALDEFILKDNYKGLVEVTILMVVLLVLQSIIQYSQTLLTNTLGQSAIKDLRINVFNHISKLRLKYFDKTPIGQLITRTVSDLETIADIFSEGLIAMVGDLLQVIVIIGCMFMERLGIISCGIDPHPVFTNGNPNFSKIYKSSFSRNKDRGFQLEYLLAGTY